jgi:hypothetical protein
MRKRSKYRPRQRMLPVVFRFDGNNERNLQLIPHDCLEDLRQGRGVEDGWHTLAARLNLGFVLARDHFNEEPQAIMAKALEALRAVYDRHERAQTWGATGEEFFAMGEGLNLTDSMQLQCTRRELQTAIVNILPAGSL